MIIEFISSVSVGIYIAICNIMMIIARIGVIWSRKSYSFDNIYIFDSCALPLSIDWIISISHEWAVV